jgi:sugar phosphate isomerase/epimerase
VAGRQPVHPQPTRAWTPASTSTTRSGNGNVDWDQFFSTLHDIEFDGIATVCVFGWEETADDIHRRMLSRVRKELGA